MQIVCEGVTGLGVNGVEYAPLPGTKHVFEIPDELGMPLLAFQGYRWPEPADYAIGALPTAPSVPVPPVPPLDTARVALEPQEDTGGQQEPVPTDEEPVVTVEETDTPTPPIGEDADLTDPEPAAQPGTDLETALVEMAKAAGVDGITTAAIVTAHGAYGGNVLRKLADEGLLIKVKRGQYVHPDHA